jgi:hypothetical protein
MIIGLSIIVYSSTMILLVLLLSPGLFILCLNPSAVSSVASGVEESPAIDILKARGRPFGRSLKLGALGRGRFLALPPMIGTSYMMARTRYKIKS